MAWINEDRFRLLVDGQEVPIAKSYKVGTSVFQVPSKFAMVVGHNGLLIELINGYCEGTPFELYVNDLRVMQGEIDDLRSVGGEETSLLVAGRDRLARLTKCELHSDRSFTEETFTSLTETALAEVGLGDVSLVSSNLANRKAITGTSKVAEIVTPTEESTEEQLAQTVQKRTKTVRNSLAMEAGTTWWNFLQPQYQRGGLFLWADSFGGFVLGQPNGKQAPIGRILRRAGGQGESGDVTFVGQPEWQRSTVERYSEYHVIGRKGSGADGRGQAYARKIDPEIVALLNKNEADRADGGKRKEIKVFKDDKVKTPEQAAFLALRKMAEARRESFTLAYTLAGHTLAALSGGGRIVPQPDTVLHVVDQVLGIDEPMYVDDVDFDRSPHSTMRISLMRCEDLLYGEEDLLAVPRRKKGGVRMGRTEVFRPKWVQDPNWGNLPTLRGVQLNEAGTGFDVIPGAERRR